jgi:hypothetical protein
MARCFSAVANRTRIALVAIGAVAMVSLGLVFAIFNDPLLPFKVKTAQTQAQESVDPCSTKGVWSVYYKGMCVTPEEYQKQVTLDQACISDPDKRNKDNEGFTFFDKTTHEQMSYCEWREAGNFSPFGSAQPAN